MPDHFDYDVFLSHSSKDKPVVRDLADRLKRDNLPVWFDDPLSPRKTNGVELQEPLSPAEVHEPLSLAGRGAGVRVEQTEHALEHSRTLILCMSENAFASDWVTLERHTSLFRDPTNTDRRFITPRLDDAPTKGSPAHQLPSPVTEGSFTP